MSPLVTIVVPCYNAELFVESTILSLLSQTYKALEIIVIDDGSTDGSYLLLERFADRITLLRQPNVGQSRTLNRGWALAQGTLIGYLSADDCIDPTAIEEIVQFSKARPEYDIFYPDYRLMDSNGAKLHEVEAREFILEDLVINMICQPGPGALFRRSVFERLDGWRAQLKQTPDFDFWLRASKNFRFARVPKSLASFRVHLTSQSFAVSSIEKAEEPVAIMEDFIASGFHDKLSGKQRFALARAHVLAARLHLRSLRMGPFMRHLSRSVVMAPSQLFFRSTFKLLMNGSSGFLRNFFQKMKSRV